MSTKGCVNGDLNFNSRLGAELVTSDWLTKLFVTHDWRINKLIVSHTDGFSCTVAQRRVEPT